MQRWLAVQVLVTGRWRALPREGAAARRTCARASALGTRREARPNYGFSFSLTVKEKELRTFKLSRTVPGNGRRLVPLLVFGAGRLAATCAQTRSAAARAALSRGFIRSRMGCKQTETQRRDAPAPGAALCPTRRAPAAAPAAPDGDAWLRGPDRAASVRLCAEGEGA